MVILNALYTQVCQHIMAVFKEVLLDWHHMYFTNVHHIHLSVCLWIMDPHSWAPKKNTSHGNEVLPQDTTHLIQRPCYQRGSPCQDPAGKDHLMIVKRRKLQWYGHASRYQVWPKPSWKAQWKGEEDKADRGKAEGQHQGMDRPGVRQVPEGSGEQGKMEKIGWKIICGAPTTLAVKGLMMMMMMVMMHHIQLLVSHSQSFC